METNKKLDLGKVQNLGNETWSTIKRSLRSWSLRKIQNIVRRLECTTDMDLGKDFRFMDLPCGTNPTNTRIHRALTAYIQYSEMHPSLSETESKHLAHHMKKFIWGMVFPDKDAEIRDITDVYGEEANVPNAFNDATVLRAHEHWQEIKKRYGVKNITVVNQGTSITAPEQCGLYALVSINQARRAHLRAHGDGVVSPRFYILNNAARVESSDGIREGGELSKSSAMLYFSFDLGDGVKHHGVTYGHATLTYLKPYITEVWELPYTDAGTQFRSLEYEKHIGLVSAIAKGALPLCYNVRHIYTGGETKEKLDFIPELGLAPNEVQFLGVDKYGNALTSGKAEDIFAQFLEQGQKSQEVKVTFLNRSKNPISGQQEPHIYTLARALGEVRNGGRALWESSTPTTDNPLRGYLSLGVFKKEAGDINEDVLENRIPAGSIVRIEKA